MINVIVPITPNPLAIVITSISGSFQNWREGNLNFKKVISLGLPAVITAQLGVYLASHFSPLLLLSLFAILLFVNVYLGFILELKELDRALILLYLEDKSYGEISEILGITVTNVATKLSRIKELLKLKFKSL